MSTTEITQYEIDERKLVQLEIMNKIDEFLKQGFMSQVSGIIGLNLIRTYIKYMDED